MPRQQAKLKLSKVADADTLNVPSLGVSFQKNVYSYNLVYKGEKTKTR
jgi:hypothetical protein